MIVRDICEIAKTGSTVILEKAVASSGHGLSAPSITSGVKAISKGKSMHDGIKLLIDTTAETCAVLYEKRILTMEKLHAAELAKCAAKLAKNRWAFGVGGAILGGATVGTVIYICTRSKKKKKPEANAV